MKTTKVIYIFFMLYFSLLSLSSSYPNNDPGNMGGNRPGLRQRAGGRQGGYALHGSQQRPGRKLPKLNFTQSFGHMRVGKEELDQFEYESLQLDEDNPENLEDTSYGYVGSGGTHDGHMYGSGSSDDTSYGYVGSGGTHDGHMYGSGSSDDTSYGYVGSGGAHGGHMYGSGSFDESVSDSHTSHPIGGLSHSSHEQSQSGRFKPRRNFPTGESKLFAYVIGRFTWILDYYAKTVRQLICDTTSIKWEFLRDAFTGAYRGIQSWFTPIIEFCSDQAGILASGGIFVLVGILVLPLVGCCMMCCRCRGECGGKLSSATARKQNHCCCAFDGCILFLAVISLLFGGVVATLVSSRILKATDIMMNSVDYALDDVLSFTELTVEQLDAVAVADAQHTKESMNRTLNRSGGALARPLRRELLIHLRPLLQNMDSIEQVVLHIEDSINSATNEANTILNEANELDNQLNLVRSDYIALKGNCSHFFATEWCNALPVSTHIPAAGDFSSAVSLSLQEDLVNDIRDVDPRAIAQKAHGAHGNISAHLQLAVAGAVDASRPVLDIMDVQTIQNNIYKVEEPLFDMKAAIYDAQNQWESLHDIPPVAATIAHWTVLVLGVMVLLVAVMSLCGCCCGLLGRRVDSAPENRSKLSHSGCCCLMGSMPFAFLLAILFCLVGGIMLIIFGNLTLTCDAWEDGSLFTEVIDNEELWEKNPVSYVIDVEDMHTKTVKELVQSCMNGATLYSILGLQDTINIPSIVNLTMIRETIPLDDLGYQTGNALNDLPVLVSPGDETKIQNILDGWPTPLAPMTDTQHLVDQIASLDLFTVGMDIGSSFLLMNNNISASATPDYNINWSRNEFMVRHRDVVTRMMGLHGSRVHSLRVHLVQYVEELESLQRYVHQAEDLLIAFKSNIAGLMATMNTNSTKLIQEGVNHLGDRVVKPVEDYVNYVQAMLENEIGNCRFVWDIYKGIKECFCHIGLDAMNCLWMTFLWVASVFIVIINFGTRLAKYLRIPDDASEVLRTRPVHAAKIEHHEKVTRSMLGLDLGPTAGSSGKSGGSATRANVRPAAGAPGTPLYPVLQRTPQPSVIKKNTRSRKYNVIVLKD